MQVIERRIAQVLVPHDHLHINQLRMFAARLAMAFDETCMRPE
jgi:hypothetical protein